MADSDWLHLVEWADDDVPSDPEEAMAQMVERWGPYLRHVASEIGHDAMMAELAEALGL